MYAAKVKREAWTKEDYDDRSLRLAYNKGQKRLDFMTLVGMTVAGGVKVFPSRILSVFAGGAVGTVFGGLYLWDKKRREDSLLRE